MSADREHTSTIDGEKVNQNHHATASIENETAAAAAASEGSSAQEPEETAQQMTLDNLSAYYGDFRAVKHISLQLEPNKITALIGPSGSGKSTMLRCLNRMHELARGGRVEGKVLLDGEDIYDPHVDPVNVRRKVGMIFQKPNPFPTMSIYDNVIAGLKLERRHRKSHLDEVVEETLRQAALWDEVKDRLNRPATALSGGQQQRLCIARTIAVKPEVILMDEPASALDPIATLKIEDLMQELTKNYTIMVVTHNMQQAARVSDYTAFLTMSEDRAGELIEAGATQDIFTNPKHELTEQYITGRFG